MHRKESKLSTREWILTIIILLLVQFLIHWISLKYGGSTSALGYVSFAGTVVSILLGLIAIIYSFVQSVSQSSSAIEIREQIERLVTAGEDITKSKDALHDSAFTIRSITENLSNQINENTTATNKIAGMFSDAKQILSSDQTEKDKTAEASYTIFSSSRIWVSMSCVILGEAIKRKWSLADTKKHLLAELAIELDMSADLTAGVVLGVLLCLEGEGFIQYNDAKPDTSIQDVGKFQTNLIEIIPHTKETNHKEFIALWKIIDKLDDSTTI